MFLIRRFHIVFSVTYWKCITTKAVKSNALCLEEMSLKKMYENRVFSQGHKLKYYVLWGEERSRFWNAAQTCIHTTRLQSEVMWCKVASEGLPSLNWQSKRTMGRNKHMWPLQLHIRQHQKGPPLTFARVCVFCAALMALNTHISLDDRRRTVLWKMGLSSRNFNTWLSN